MHMCVCVWVLNASMSRRKDIIDVTINLIPLYVIRQKFNSNTNFMLFVPFSFALALDYKIWIGGKVTLLNFTFTRDHTIMKAFIINLMK